MSSNQAETTARIKTDRETDGTTGTIQLLVADKGNRTAIRKMLSEHFDVETSRTVQDVDLYLIEDHLFPEYHETLRERVEQEHPSFCPVVLIRRQTTELAHPSRDAVFHEGPMLIDDVIDAPIDRSLLIRRLYSLLVRCRQSQELSSHVSALEEREQELRRFERGVESTGNGIVMTDRFGEIDYVNPAFEKITGYTGSEVIGDTPRVLQPAGAADVFTGEFWRTMLDREEWMGEVVIEHSDGMRSVVDTSITAIHDTGEDVEGFVIVLNDITERIEQEQELQRREGELDLLRQILTRYLRHNLRNDLNVILGYAEMLVSDETLSDSHVEMVETIVEMAQRLQNKSDTARQFSTLLQQDTALSLYDLSEIVNESIRTISEQYPDVTFDIDVPEACEIRARKGIRDAVEELIENAAEHADTASPNVQIDLRDLNGARLVIEDDGPGISELELSTLEEGKETPLSHSLGIGLWLSKWAIEGVDGELSFDRLDPGTRVTVEFPPPERVGSTGLDIPTLKERDQRLQTVINRMTDAIIEVNAAWDISELDARAEDILDVSVEEVLGRDLWDVFRDTRDTEFEAVYRDVMNSRTSQHVEAYHPGIDGWLSVYVYPEFDGGLSFYFRETTERNRRQQQLQRARSRMEIALRVTDSTVWDWDVETDAVTTHPEPHGAFGTEITAGSEFLDSIYPEDRSQVQKALETAIETKTPYSAEYRVQRGNEIRWIEDYGELRRGGGDDSKRLIGVAKDITERKRREQELHRSKRAMDRAPAGITITDPEKEDNPLIYVNDRFCQLTGYTEAECLDRNCRFLQGENTDPGTVARIREAIDAEQPVTAELRNYRKDGTEFWNRLSITPVYDEDGSLVNYVGFQQDITEHKERRRRYEAIFNQTYQFTGLMEPDGTLIEANETALNFGGISREDIIGKRIWNAHWFQISEETQKQTKADVQRAAEGGFVRRELTVQGEDDTVMIDFSIRPVTDEDGNVVLLVPEGRDITDLKERERELRQEQQFVKSIFDALPDPLYAFNTDGHLIRWNEQLETVTGYSDDELEAMYVTDFVPTEDTEEIAEAFNTILEGGQLVPIESALETKDGDQIPYEFTGGPLEDTDGTLQGVTGIGRDISERKTRKEQIGQAHELLEHTERIADVGSWEIDTDTMDVYWSENLFEILGIDDDESPPLNEALDVYHEDDRPIVETAVENALETGEPFDVEARIRRSDGEIRWLRIRGTPTVESGEVVTLRGAVQDITGHK